MIKRLSNYLRTYRKRNGLSQTDLAFLLGNGSRVNISRYEHHASMPSLEIALAYEVVFGVPACELFAGVFEEAQTQILKKARLLAKRLTSVPTTPTVTSGSRSLDRMCRDCPVLTFL